MVKKNDETQAASKFVKDTLAIEDNKSALAIVENEKGELMLSYNSKYEGLSSITDMIAAFIVSQSDDDKFGQQFYFEFINSLARLNGVSAKAVEDLLKKDHPLKTAEDVQMFISGIMEMIRSQINPTGVVMALSNTDPDDIANDPTKIVPTIIQFSGNPVMLAHEVRAVDRQLSGKAYEDKEEGAFSLDDSNNQKFVQRYNETMDYLNDGKKSNK